MKRVVPLALALALAGCAPAKPPAINPSVRAVQRIADADALIKEGCYDCLADALTAYDEARAVSATAETATTGAVRAAMLLSMRERELGVVDSGFLARAQTLAATVPPVESVMAPLLEVAATMPMQSGGSRGVQAASDAQLAIQSAAYRNRTPWTARLKARATDDPASAYLYLSFLCNYDSPTLGNVKAWTEELSGWSDLPLMKFRFATCGSYDERSLAGLLAADARFQEVHYFGGLRGILGGDLDAAAAELDKAYAWHPQWPAVTHSIANVYFTAEDFESALTYFDKTLALADNHPDALLGKVKALTYLTRPADAIAVVDQLLALEHWYVGDAHYWRAYNELQLSQNAEAWTDIEVADRLMVNAQVPKLAGLIAYRLQQLETARTKFELSKSRDATDCETGLYLGLVLVDQRVWAQATPALTDASVCLAASNDDLRKQIERTRASDDPPARKARRIARSEATIAQQERMRTQAQEILNR